MNYGVYHGCHNSFVIGQDKVGIDYSKEAKKQCEIYKTDGFIIFKDNPIEMLYYNSDGSRAPMCGNGVRCFIKYGYDLGLLPSPNFTVKTLSGDVEVQITKTTPFTVKANLGKPNFSTHLLGIDTKAEEFINQEINVLGKIITCSAIFMNTHHLVIFVHEFDDLLNLANNIHEHPIFKDKINVNFVIVDGKNKLRIKTFERGVGWTKACGTGAASAFAVSYRLGFVGEEAEVTSAGGTLHITSANDDVIMEGPVVTIKEPVYESRS